MQIPSQFVSGKDTFFITLTKLNELKVWNVFKPEGSNLVCDIRQPLSSRSTCFATFYSDNSFLAAIGSENGTIAVWDILTKSKITQYQRHKASITALEFIDETSIISASEDLDLTRYNRTSKEEKTSKLSAVVNEIQCLSDSVLCAGAVVETLNLKTLSRMRKFLGDAKAIKLLRVSPDQKYFLGATQDRFINVYKTVGKSSKNAKPKFQLRCDAQPVSLSIFQEGKSTKVAAVTDKGHCLLWTLDLASLKKVKEPMAHHQAICFASPPSISTSLRAAFFQSSSRVVVAKGPQPQPTFQTLALTSEKRIVLTDAATGNKLSKKRKRNEVEVIGASDSKTNGITKKNAKRVKLDPISKASSSPNPPARPQAGTLETLVTQAITTQDQTLFHEILRPKKPGVVKNTVVRLQLSDAEALLHIACDEFRKNFRRGPDLMPWIEELVSHHGLHVKSDLLKRLSSTVEHRVKYLQPVLKLQGKVQLLIQRKSTVKQVEAQVVFNE